MYFARLFRADTPMQALTDATSWVNSQVGLSEVSVSAFYDFAERPAYVAVISAKQHAGATKC